MNSFWSLVPAPARSRRRAAVVILLAVVAPLLILLTMLPQRSEETLSAAIVNLDTPIEEGSEPVAAGKLLTEPKLEAIAKRHNASTSEVVLAWQWALGVPVNPEATAAEYQRENLEFVDVKLSPAELAELSAWSL